MGQALTKAVFSQYCNYYPDPDTTNSSFRLPVRRRLLLFPEKTHSDLLSHFVLRIIIFSRQARDKHRENGFFCFSMQHGIFFRLPCKRLSRACLDNSSFAT